MTQNVQLAPDDGVFELAGPEPIWIWAHTCPTPRCECRTALVVASIHGRSELLERGAPIRDAWKAGSSYAEVALGIGGLTTFALNIDSAETYLTDGDEPLDLADHPEVRAVAERVDGEVLDSLGRLWFRGKGVSDPEEQAQLAAEVIMRGWQPGDLVAWNDMLTGVRNDTYVLDERVYEASEMYCPMPDCACGEVEVHLETLMPRGAPPPGSVRVVRDASATLNPFRSGRDRLERLWVAFQRRHPRYRERFERRSIVMKRMGARIAMKAGTAVGPGVGRNDPCPCGSGRKYKKCCAGRAPAAEATRLPKP